MPPLRERYESFDSADTSKTSNASDVSTSSNEVSEAESGKLVINPGPFDVLFGRGRPFIGKK